MTQFLTTKKTKGPKLDFFLPVKVSIVDTAAINTMFSS